MTEQKVDLNKYVSFIYEKVGPNFTERVNPASIPVLIKEGMELVETYKKELSGAQRKEVLILFMKKIVDGAPLTDEHKGWCNTFLDVGASTTIDVIILASKGLMSINKKCCADFWKKYCCCC